MPITRPQLHVDFGFYAETQLTDSEIVEREAMRQAQAEKETIQERERRRRMFSFHWQGGML